MAVILALACRRENPPRIEMIATEQKTLAGMSFALRKIPAGEVVTGSHRSVNPVRRFAVRELWLATTPVTNADYEQFDPSHVRAEFSKDDDAPVTDVTWHDANRFCEWLSAKYGVRARMPTSIEWEYACLGGGSGPYPFGKAPVIWDQPARKYANFLSDRAVAATRYPPNGFGLHGFAGNVAELCADAYVRDENEVRRFPGDPDYDALAALPRSSLKATKGCHARRTTLYGCECSALSATVPDRAYDFISFRIAVEERP